MPYLYRRTNGLVDLFLETFYRKKVFLKDGTTEEGVYTIVLNEIAFVVEDPAAGADSSAAILTDFETAINADDRVPITATAVGNELVLLPDEAGEDFSIETSTTDDEGVIYYRDAPPDAFQAKSLSNWDQAPVDIAVVSQFGTSNTKPSVPAESMADFLTSHYYRFRFNPVDYGLEDDDVLYFQFAPIFDGVEGDVGPIYILLTREQLLENHTALILRGTAPAAADSDSALEFELPWQTSSIVAVVEAGGADAFLSFGTGDAEIPLAVGESFRDNKFGSGDLRVRGDGAPTNIYIYLSLNAQRFL